MRCNQCRQAMIPDPAFDNFNEHLTLRVTVWYCAGCGEVVEEILCDPAGEADRPRRMRYPVREWTGCDRPLAGRSRTGRRKPLSLAA